MSSSEADSFIDLDLPNALGADAGVSIQSFAIYVPSRDRKGVDIVDQRKWVLEALNLLGQVGGGATAMPPTEGIWFDAQGGVVRDHPVVVFSYIFPDRLATGLPNIREFLHRMGRETDQGEVVFEFDQSFYRIRKFDPPGPTSNDQIHS